MFYIVEYVKENKDLYIIYEGYTSILSAVLDIEFFKLCDKENKFCYEVKEEEV